MVNQFFSFIVPSLLLSFSLLSFSLSLFLYSTYNNSHYHRQTVSTIHLLFIIIKHSYNLISTKVSEALVTQHQHALPSIRPLNCYYDPIHVFQTDPIPITVVKRKRKEWTYLNTIIMIVSTINQGVLITEVRHFFFLSPFYCFFLSSSLPLSLSLSILFFFLSFSHLLNVFCL